MSFIQPCFIRKDTPELRKNLELLGIEVIIDPEDCSGGLLAQHGTAVNVWSKAAAEDLSSIGVVNCEENEQLFLALAALRDDSCYMQWFVYRGKWDIWKYIGHPHEVWANIGLGVIFLKGHKATPKELIKHFGE